MYMTGGSVGFFLGDIRALMDDLKHLRPTLMPCVPRLLNRIYDKVSGPTALRSGRRSLAAAGWLQPAAESNLPMKMYSLFFVNW